MQFWWYCVINANLKLAGWCASRNQTIPTFVLWCQEIGQPIPGNFRSCTCPINFNKSSLEYPCLHISVIVCIYIYIYILYIYICFFDLEVSFFSHLETPQVSQQVCNLLSLQRRLLRAFCKTLNCLNSGSGCVLLTHWWETKVARPIVASKRSSDPSSWEKNDQVDFEDSGDCFCFVVAGFAKVEMLLDFLLLQDSKKVERSSFSHLEDNDATSICQFIQVPLGVATVFHLQIPLGAKFNRSLDVCQYGKSRILWINSSWTLFGSICYVIACFIFMKTPNPRTTNLYSQIVA